MASNIAETKRELTRRFSVGLDLVCSDIALLLLNLDKRLFVFYLF